MKATDKHLRAAVNALAEATEDMARRFADLEGPTGIAPLRAKNQRWEYLLEIKKACTAIGCAQQWLNALENSRKERTQQ